jgi:hypothetical protein
MTLAELESAQHAMQQKWYELIQAEQRGGSQQLLECLYHAYLLAVDEYNRRFALFFPSLQAENG